jgi:hypothetical protein
MPYVTVSASFVSVRTAFVIVGATFVIVGVLDVITSASFAIVGVPAIVSVLDVILSGARNERSPRPPGDEQAPCGWVRKVPIKKVSKQAPVIAGDVGG